VNQAITRFDEDTLSDSETTVVSSGLNYSLSRRQTVGGGITATDQSTDSRLLVGNRLVVGDANGNPSVPIDGVSCDLSGVPQVPPGGAVIARVPCTIEGQDTQFVQLFGRWSLTISPRWQFRIQAGPTHIRPSVGSSSTTLFANTSLSHRAKNTTWVGGFSRTESGAFGATSSTVASTFRSTWIWKPSELWKVTLVGAYSLRESVQQNNNSKIDTYTASVTANRRLTRRLTGVVSLSYRDQKNSGALNQASRGFNSFETGIGVQYDFDPVLF
jgi:hypothetical protein